MRKTKAAIMPTPEDNAKFIANEIKSTRQKIGELKQKLKELEPQLIDYMNQNKVLFFDGFTLVKKAGTFSWAGKKNKELKLALDELSQAIPPKYLSIEIDKDKVFSSMNTDNSLFGAMTKVGLTLKQNNSTVSLKSDKSDDSE